MVEFTRRWKQRRLPITLAVLWQTSGQKYSCWESSSLQWFVQWRPGKTSKDNQDFGHKFQNKNKNTKKWKVNPSLPTLVGPCEPSNGLVFYSTCLYLSELYKYK